MPIHGIEILASRDGLGYGKAVEASHILVDGYSMIFQWPELVAAQKKGIGAARDELIRMLTRFHDREGGALTVVFDGRSVPPSGEAVPTGIRVVYTRGGRTADAEIERIVGRDAAPERFLVATDDRAERMTAEALGAHTMSSEFFRERILDAACELRAELDRTTAKATAFRRR
ncbi:MAG: NYN domain-containing protein [Verrucomicrobiae bacterium]|nr:NYN domain-containing protein [Verrucomicrobiae bacterium]